MSAWFEQLVVDIGRLRLSCFFVSFIAAFLFIRFSVRMLRAQGEVVARERHTGWGAHSPRGLRPGLHVWAESAALAVQDNRLGWAATAAALLGIGMALVLDEFVLVLHLEDVCWSK